jgi:hypothetical protein
MNPVRLVKPAAFHLKGSSYKALEAALPIPGPVSPPRLLGRLFCNMEVKH